MSKPIAVDLPSSSRLIPRIPFYYGWVILLVGTFGLIMTSPGQTYAVSIFIEHFITDLGISRSLVSTLYTVGTLVGSFALPFVGRQFDKRGARTTMVVISGLFGLVCIYMGFVQNALMLLLGFTGIRMLGQGSLSLVSTNVINQWWVERRGLIMGVSGLLLALFGTGLFPNLIQGLIEQVGWRSTYMLLGGSLLLVMVPMAYLFVRHAPEMFGLLPDGRLSPAATVTTAAPLVEEHWTREEARRTAALWIVTLGIASIGMLSTGLTFHMVSIFADNGLPAALAATVYVPLALTTAVVNLSSGILVNRFPIRIMLAVALLLQAVTLIMAQYLQSVTLAFVYGIALGCMMGLSRTVGTVIWATYFGRRYLGSITGMVSTITIAGSALGPMPMGIARDLLGSYNLALNLFAIIPLVLAVAALFIKRPSKV